MMETVLFKRFSALMFGYALACVSALPAVAAVDPQIELSSAEVNDGSVVLITAHLPSDMAAKNLEVSGEFENTQFYFYAAPERGEGVYEALVGVPHNHQPGPADIKITVGDKVKSLPIKISDAKYPSETLKVSNRHVNPNKKDLLRIKRDIEEVAHIYSTVTKEKLWKGAFVLPINSPMTSVYGTKRVFNGKMQSYHNGIDLKAPTGTPIHAAGGGVVVLAKSLFFTGNTVLIDHGYGVVTLYAHMSRIKVKKGDHIEAGQELGLSGMTGRANGPHLHWGVVINKVKVNPADFMKVVH